MKKISISENKFRIVLSQILKEAIQKAPVFGSGRHITDYSPVFQELAKIENLHKDRYKDYELEDAWNEWKNVGCDKHSNEYFIYISKFKNFMFGNGGFLRNLSYVADRTNGPLHLAILDNQWSRSLVGTKDWKYSDVNSGNGGDEFHCFYTTVLKLFQNPAIWNDFFFNPLFAKDKAKYDSIRIKITNIMKSNKESYETQYKPLLPLEEYKQLNFFMNEVNQETKKVEKGLNCKPELFYEPQFDSEDNFVDDDDEEY